MANTPGIEKVAMTTNGYRLKERAQEWFDAGLNALNVSVDSLDPRQFHQNHRREQAGGGDGGIEAALAAGFKSVKINAVLLKGLNDQQLDQFLAWIRRKPIELRFIELMQTGEDGQPVSRPPHQWRAHQEQLLGNGWIQQLRAVDDGPAQVFMHPESQGERRGSSVPYSKDFCAGCNRLRVSSVGSLHLCLFGDNGVELRDLLSDDSRAGGPATADPPGAYRQGRHPSSARGQCRHDPHLASIGG